jgi:RNA polymerase sigma-70 factor (family 1)
VGRQPSRAANPYRAVTLRMESDEDLLGRVRGHNERALRELVARYYTRLGDFSFSLLGRRDLAEEAVLNVFLNVWRRRETLAIKGVVRSYLFAAVSNQSLNLRKRHRRHDAVTLDEAIVLQIADAKRAESDLLFSELEAEVEALIMLLPSQRQLIFRMHRLDGLRYAQIATKLGLSERTVQNHMIQAMKQLAEELPKLRSKLRRERMRPS